MGRSDQGTYACTHQKLNLKQIRQRGMYWVTKSKEEQHNQEAVLANSSQFDLTWDAFWATWKN